MHELPRSGRHADTDSGVWPPHPDDHGSDFWFSIAEGRDGVTVFLEGELDIITLPDVCLALELASAGGAPVTLKCTRLMFADAAALRFLRRAHDRARSAGSDLTLSNPQETVRRMLALTALVSLVSERKPSKAPAPRLSDRTAILRAAADATGQLAGAPRASAQLADPAARQLHMAAQGGFGQPFLEFFAVVADNSSACGTVLRRGSSVWVPDVARSPAFSRTAAQVMLDAGATAVASVPVRAPGGELIAVLSAHHETPRTWPDVTQRHLERLATVTRRLIWQQGNPPSGEGAGCRGRASTHM